MIPKNQYKYILTDRFGTIEVSPLGESDFSIDYEQESEGKYFYSREFQGKIMFVGEVYNRLKTIEQSIYICTSQRIQILRICNDVEQIIFDGTFNLTNGDWDPDKCKVILKFEKSKIDKCLEDNKNVKVNLLLEINPHITVNTGTAGGVLEYKECEDTVAVYPNSPDPYCNVVWCNGSTPDCDLTDAYANNWVQYYENVFMDGSVIVNPDPEHPNEGGLFKVRTKWVREIVTVPCGTPVPPEWIQIEPCLSGEEKYAKKATLYNCGFTVNDFTDNWNYRYIYQCSVLGGAGGTFTDIDNGILLNDAIKLMVSRFCGLNTVSDFFQINPSNPSDINYVTGLTSQVNNLVLFQKSDVKRPQDLNNAITAQWTFEKLYEALRLMFNVYYSIDNGVFRLEHISWFSRSQGYDLTLPKYSKYVNGLNRYTYDLDNIPQSEKWIFKEQLDAGEWGVNEIDYNTTCAIGGNKSNDQIYTVDELMTDVELCFNNPSSDNNTVSDSGFVMIATVIYGGQYYIISENDGRLNNPLSWARLIPRYHFYNRPVNRGVFNNQNVSFFSTKPFKKGDKISIPIECGEVFNPNNTVLTQLGTGIIEKATFNMKTCMMDLELKYNVFGALTDNDPPVIVGEDLQTYKNEPLIFDLDVTDIDGSITSIQVKNQPPNGHVDILSLTQAKYTPNNNFIGDDYFTLVCFDNWSEISNDGTYVVHVLNTNQPPVAVDDEYYVYHGEAFTSPIGILNNDSDDTGFTLITTSVTTAQGVLVSISPTGIFSYTPITGFEGNDTFDYTIEDGAGLQSTATVTLIVGYKNKPIAVDDNYTIIINTTLVTDGSEGKEYLWENDYTPDGLIYTYTCNSETKSTAQGGTVTINSNGTFTYTPPTGFIGTDNFSYTVNNVNGSAVGMAYIHVTPVVYVQMVKNDIKIGSHVIDCSGVNELGGNYHSHDIVLRFFADSGKTIPYDVTGLNFKVKIKQVITTHPTGGPTDVLTDIWLTDVLTGTQQLLIDDLIYNDEMRDCSFTVTWTQTIVTSLEAGNYIIVT